MGKLPLKKKILLILFVFIFLQLLSCKHKGQRIEKKYPDGTPAIIYEFPDRDDTSKYTKIMNYSTGKIYQLEIVENGKYSKSPIIYYPSGAIQEIDSLFDNNVSKHNTWDGIATTFYENGAIAERFEIKNGRINGLTEHFNKDGKLVKEYYVINDSVKNGIYKEFYKTGKLLVMANYHNDSLVGYWYAFKENGDTLKYYNTFKGGEDMPYKRWLDNGTILMGDYIDSRRKAVIWKWVDKSGKELKRKITYPLPNGAFVSPERN